MAERKDWQRCELFDVMSNVRFAADAHDAAGLRVKLDRVGPVKARATPRRTTNLTPSIPGRGRLITPRRQHVRHPPRRAVHRSNLIVVRGAEQRHVTP